MRWCTGGSRVGLAVCYALHADGLIQKITKTHRYQVTTRGREQITAILAVRAAGVEELIAAA